jgi:hypothetical protein
LRAQTVDQGHPDVCVGTAWRIAVVHYYGLPEDLLERDADLVCGLLKSPYPDAGIKDFFAYGHSVTGDHLARN